MADKNGRKKEKGTSLAKGPVATIGLISLAWGIINLLTASHKFTAKPIEGPAGGMGKFLGFAGNGWTNALFIAAGLLLLFGSPMHWAAKSMSLIVGLILGAASVIAMVDKQHDVFGIAATNGPTQLLLGAGATALILLSLLPRVGKKKRHDDDVAERPVARERVAERERVVEREPRMDDARPAHVVDRQVVGRDDAPDERSGRFERELDPRDERLTDRGTTSGTPSRRDERL